MAEYIEREALINELSASCMPIDNREIPGLLGCNESIRDIIDAMPATDVRPERHGEWKGYTTSAFHGVDEFGDPIYRNVNVWKCSECYRKSVIKENFCPNCGAMMDGKDGESDG